jgi:uncharacterized protein (DUF2252 family)
MQPSIVYGPRCQAVQTPAVWVCGDLHLENFGVYRGDNGLAYFDIADFDEAVLAPSARDLTRLVTSALLAARRRSLDRRFARELCELLVGSYAEALAEGKARWVDRALAQGLLRSLFHRVLAETRAAFLARRIRRGPHGHRLIIDGKRTLPAGDDDRNRIQRALDEWFSREREQGSFRLRDVARRIAGTGALGLERYTLLVDGGVDSSEPALLDLKYASPSALVGSLETHQPRWKTEADRVVAVQRRVQAIPPAYLQPITIGKKSYVMRALMPTQDTLDLSRWHGASAGLGRLARDLGCVVAWSQLRSAGREGSATIDELIDLARRRRWRRAVVEFAEHYSEVAWRDWKDFRVAYRDKALVIE